MEKSLLLRLAYSWQTKTFITHPCWQGRDKSNWGRHRYRHVTMFCVKVTGQYIAPLLTLSRGTINQRRVLNAPDDAVSAVDGWTLTFFLPGWKDLWDMFTHRQTVLFFRSQMATAVGRVFILVFSRNVTWICCTLHHTAHKLQHMDITCNRSKHQKIFRCGWE